MFEYQRVEDVRIGIIHKMATCSCGMEYGLLTPDLFAV